jgi:hypothetical protein
MCTGPSARVGQLRSLMELAAPIEYETSPSALACLALWLVITVIIYSTCSTAGRGQPFPAGSKIRLTGHGVPVNNQNTQVNHVRPLQVPLRFMRGLL